LAGAAPANGTGSAVDATAPVQATATPGRSTEALTQAASHAALSKAARASARTVDADDDGGTDRVTDPGADSAGASAIAACETDPASPNAQATQAQSTDTSSVSLALTEGSDATGATASALQAVDAAAAPAAASPISVALGSWAQQAVPGVTDSVSSAATAAVAASNTSLTANGGDTHARSGAGDANSGTNGDGAAALQQLSSSGGSASSGAAAAPTVRVHADVDSADFPQSLADRVSFAVESGWDSARLQVNPPQLGPIELQVAIQGEHAQVSMSTHSAVTREALESSLPKLREMLSSQGFTQVSVDISQRSFQERSAAPQPYEWASPLQTAAAPVPASPGTTTRTSQGMLDAYA
jgi:flagellar hook-length control protein FliK